MIGKKIIYGCESRGDGGIPYLTRFTLIDSKIGRLYLHVFHRSDHDVMHDHPWSFWTLVLWRGYTEEYVKVIKHGNAPVHSFRTEREVYPGMILRRAADFTHRVQLHHDAQGKVLPAVTLVWANKPERKWGFHTPEGWEGWREYFRKMGC